MSPVLIVVLLGLVLGLQPLATDLYLPALPSIQGAFTAQVAQVQLTLTAFLLAFGCSQLAWGPLSDRFGRRPILMTGMAMYALGALGCSSAESMEALIAWRTLQGAALGAGVTCARAMVRDLFAPHLGAQVMSKALTGLGVLAFLSPISGSLLVNALGWRSTMLAQALMGVLAFALVALRFTESLARTNPAALQPLALARNWATIVRHPSFQAYQLLTCCTYAGLFTHLAASSFIYIQVLGVSRTGYGVLLGSNALCYIAGTFLCRWLLQRMDVQRTVQLAGLASLLSATAIGIAALAESRSLWAYALPFYVFQIAHGVHMPCGQSNAIAPFPQSAGTASALNGFTMMLIAFAMGHWLGLNLDGQSTRPMAFGIWFWGVCTALVAWVLVRRHGQVDGRR
ncbi:multidrug effflux MFS transporter [Delftia sp. PS-11]|uniref:multidrug effflux MFS transporter n=1 Tax=Delftia sp. PS-11 TaxID=2767222 RepID=UPI002455670A|nr:multidrug effflux MFS transporter [Delftia sp. PS-11]KAJ8745165.1 multidrug effflux MFS transporter [Delftia sp. PS-11]